MNNYYVMDGDHFDGPFSLVEGIELLLKFNENPSPEMMNIVLTRRNGQAMQLCKVNGVPVNVGYFDWNKEVDAEQWVNTHTITCS